MQKMGKESDFQKILIDWYEKEKRPLPWRSTNDPYRIWLSEIILQQTRVDQGLPYYLKFVEKYPTVQKLAMAPEDEVLRLWQGLGYYSRARNLHSTAKHVTKEFNGLFPKTAENLEKLKGVGKYTAAAIASFAYNEKVAVCDGNVQRVLARVFGIEADISTGKGLKSFQAMAQDLIVEHRPDVYNQAIMEFGAIQCTPKNYDCDACPLNGMCFAFKKEMQSMLPVKTKKLKQKTRHFNYLLLEFQGRYYMHRRGPKDIWQGLYEPYLQEDNQNWKGGKIDTGIEFKGDIISESQMYKHVLSHQIIRAVFYHVKLKTIPLELSENQFYSSQELEELPKPILVVNYLNHLKI